MGGCVSDECKFKWIFLFCFVDIKKKVESVEPPSLKKKKTEETDMFCRHPLTTLKRNAIIHLWGSNHCFESRVTVNRNQRTLYNV